MTTKHAQAKKLDTAKLKSGRRQTVGTSPEDWIRTAHLDSEKPIPVVIYPVTDGVDLLAWAANNREFIETLLWEHKSLLFRRFNVKAASAFEQFVKATSNTELLEYRDRSTPRQSRGDKVYTSTIYPADQRINLHNEGTYWRTWPLKIYFCCTRAPQEGGATPIADVSRVFLRIGPDVRDRFVEKGVMYVRNYNDGFGLPWQEVFQTSDKGEVEAYCRQNSIEFEWKGDDRLRTRQIRPAVRRHPVSGETVWFNHAAFFHVSALEPAVRETLLAEFKEEDLPYQTFYGDGTPIDPTAVAQILEAYRQEQVIFPWQEGDLLLQDNMGVAHGREPYVGEREVLAAMSEPYSGEDAAASK